MEVGVAAKGSGCWAETMGAWEAAVALVEPVELAAGNPSEVPRVCTPDARSIRMGEGLLDCSDTSTRTMNESQSPSTSCASCPRFGASMHSTRMVGWKAALRGEENVVATWVLVEAELVEAGKAARAEWAVEAVAVGANTPFRLQLGI